MYDYARETQPSHLCTNDSELPGNKHPITRLLALIEEEELSADIVICPGDLGDKANRAGIRYVWERLQTIATALGAERLVTTSGNHDLDSRYMTSSFDPKAFLRGLSPRYPFPDDALNNKYWTDNYVILNQAKCRIVVLNSCAYHGGSEDEKNYGRVAEETVASLLLELSDVAKYPKRCVNVLVCHHHPHRYGDIEDDDYSAMVGAHRLLEGLADDSLGNWIIIHGHKHQPRICYSAGSTASPLIFCAGSFSAVLYPELQPIVRNQFYLLEFPVDSMDTMGLGLIGTFRSWDWGMGWKGANSGSGLPVFGGFGNRTPRAVVVEMVRAAFETKGEAWLPWSAMTALVPGLEFLLPDDIEYILGRLESDHGLHVLVNRRNGQREQIGRRG